MLVRTQAAPINPSDQGLMFAGADVRTATASGTAARPVVTMSVPAAALKMLAGRLDQSLPVGNEGAGVVVGAGSSETARALMGRNVAAYSAPTYSQYRCVEADQCLVLPANATIRDGASAWVNPMTVLGMLETMRSEGHHAIVHTAAASNLGQMLQRVCTSENIKLVNVVRSEQQESVLRSMGAAYVCNSRSPDFTPQLIAALAATGATIAFDATGGGMLAGQILSAMEEVQRRSARTYSRYGSTVHKQVYVYGSLDRNPIELVRDFGMAWGVGGWLLPIVLRRIGPAAVEKLKQRVISELTTVFASKYAMEISLTQALQLDMIAIYQARATGKKFLINPNKLP